MFFTSVDLPQGLESGKRRHTVFLFRVSVWELQLDFVIAEFLSHHPETTVCFRVR